MSLSKISKLKARFQAVAVRHERLNQVGGSAYCLFLFLELRESWRVLVLEISAMTFLAIDSSESSPFHRLLTSTIDDAPECSHIVNASGAGQSSCDYGDCWTLLV